MLLATLAQLRLAASVAFGTPFGLWSLDRVVDSLLAPGASSASSRGARRRPTS